MKKFWWTLVILTPATVILSCGDGSSQQTTHVYGTWDNMEVDKCASAWLLKRHVDTLAEFVFFPVGQIVTEAIPFDTPDAELRRTGKHSAFQNILREYGLDDPGLKSLGEIIDELEIRSWEVTYQRKSQAARQVDSLIRDIINTANGPDECFRTCFEALDSLYEQILHAEGAFGGDSVN